MVGFDDGSTAGESRANMAQDTIQKGAGQAAGRKPSLAKGSPPSEAQGRADSEQPGGPPTGAALNEETAAMPPVVVKKYANRRLYNTESSSYVTLEDLAVMVRHGRHFVVYDAKSGEDITRGVLTQIIVEEEAKGRNLLPTSFLRQIIGFYGDSMQSLVPRYLESVMGAFSRQHDQVRRTVEQTMGGFIPFTNLEEMGKQNMAMMERAMSLFSPFRAAGEQAEPQPDSARLAALQAELEALRQQIEHYKAMEAAKKRD
ncbi:polyhydroxyalkanoate synthesis repressor PhaR [Falsiroseomonas sp. HC035]|uniref:polyhydroxyalkanoate synthesis repressor PhaR n=1 Tax=Falsiroseomonas sp. HC035 TaxID=3390999 RepID=UPI003D31CFF7